MNRNHAGWKWLLYTGILLMLAASGLRADDQTNSPAAKPLPLDNVWNYISGSPTNTSLQNERAVKELKGKVYTGVVIVRDVIQAADGTIEIKAGSRQSRPLPLASFPIKDSQLQKKAADLRMQDFILITARLWNLWEGQEVEFYQVQSLDVLPKNKPEEKK